MTYDTNKKEKMGISRRKFVTLITLIGIGGMAFLSTIFLKKNRVLNAVHSIIEPIKPKLKSVSPEGQTISVETALNSRCTSDYDDDQRRSHWGMFEASKKLTTEQIENIVSLAKIPRFSDQNVEIRAKKNILTFVIQKNESETINEWAMIESGMQQQAVGLVCAAMGVGMVFSNLGKDGKSISESEHATIRIKLAPTKPSYNGKFWSNQPPEGVWYRVLMLLNLATAEASSQTSNAGIWISPAEVAVFPMSGPAWNYLKSVADAPLRSSPNLSKRAREGIQVLAKALAHARTGNESYRQEVITVAAMPNQLCLGRTARDTCPGCHFAPCRL